MYCSILKKLISLDLFLLQSGHMNLLLAYDENNDEYQLNTSKNEEEGKVSWNVLNFCRRTLAIS